MSVHSTLRQASIALVITAAFAAASPVLAQGRFHLHGVRGARGTAVGGGYTTAANGVVQHRGGRVIQGANGASYRGQNSYTRDADGSAQASYSHSGTTAAGGTFGGSGAYARSSDGSISGSSQSSGSGPQGSYQRSTSVADGVATHNATATNASGENYTGQTVYTKGQGVTHSGTCTDAGGQVIPCHD